MPPTTAPITPDDHYLAVHAIATMIAQWWDTNGHPIVHNGNSDPTTQMALPHQ
jgi:hypothetical protein